MLCERCNKKKATIFYRENTVGKVRALRLCAECTDILEAAGELEDISAAVAGFASPLCRAEEGSLMPGLLHGGDTKCVAAASACPICGQTVADVAESGKVGCALCYKTFADILAEVVEAVHGKAEHIGRTAARERVARARAERVETLKRELQEAISAEQFEAAAALRDEIRTLAAEQGA